MKRNSVGSAGKFGTVLSRRSIALALAIALVVALPTAGPAQETPKSYKKWYLAVGGAILAAIPAYVFTADGGFESGCSSKGCVTLVAAIIGGSIGFLVGMEVQLDSLLRSV